jgi:hypothetical protein
MLSLKNPAAIKYNFTTHGLPYKCHVYKAKASDIYIVQIVARLAIVKP